MGIKIAAASGGSVELVPTNTTSNFTVTVPAITGTAVLQNASNNLLMNSGYGSDAVAYGCRAWVNFNGTGTVAIRASGNVSSITDNGTGDYTVNFTTAMPNANYSASGHCIDTSTSSTNGSIVCGARGSTPTASAFRFTTKFNQDAGLFDFDIIHIQIIR